EIRVIGRLEAPLSKIESPSYPIEIQDQDLDAGRFSLRLTPDHHLPDQDFVLFMWAKAAEIAPALLLYRAPQPPGAFLLTVLPDRDLVPPRVAGREMIFVLDRSGSMRGAPLDQARRALSSCLRTLGPKDTFRLITFDDRVEELCEDALLWSQTTLE